MPILPMVLVNGADGIGTGWSTSIPNYNPRDIVANLLAALDGRPLSPMKPWYKARTLANARGVCCQCDRSVQIPNLQLVCTCATHIDVRRD